MLLIAVGLTLRAFRSLLGKDPGFETQHVLTMNVTVAAASDGRASPVRRFLDPALQAIRGVPGVEAAGSINLVPYVNWGWNSNTRYEGTPGGNPTRLPLVEQRMASPGFFGVTRQRLIAGRLLEPRDDDSPTSPPVVVVNEALAKRVFKGRNPVGHRFYVGDSSFATIVGEVSDIRNVGPVADPAPVVAMRVE